MIEAIVAVSLWVGAAYGAMGLLFVPLFHRRMLAAIDPATVGTALSFRILITPGLVALWPFIVAKWLRARDGREAPARPDKPVSPRLLRRVHALLTVVLAIALPPAIAAALMTRPGVYFDEASIEPAAFGFRYGVTLSRHENYFGDLPIDVSLMMSPGNIQVLQFIGKEQFDVPALAVYWVPGDSEGITEGVFLGKVWGISKRIFSIPDVPEIEAGRLVLYSIERSEVIAEAPYPDIPDSVRAASSEAAEP